MSGLSVGVSERGIRGGERIPGGVLERLHLYISSFGNVQSRSFAFFTGKDIIACTPLSRNEQNNTRLRSENFFPFQILGTVRLGESFTLQLFPLIPDNERNLDSMIAKTSAIWKIGILPRTYSRWRRKEKKNLAGLARWHGRRR